MDKLLIISIIESIYIIFMFRYFKTTYSFNLLPYQVFNNSEYLKHQKTNSEVPISHICQLGNDICFLIGLYLVGRNFCKPIMEYNQYIIYFIFICCFSNLNALIYFLPILFIEIYLLNNGYKIK